MSVTSYTRIKLNKHIPLLIAILSFGETFLEARWLANAQNTLINL